MDRELKHGDQTGFFTVRSRSLLAKKARSGSRVNVKKYGTVRFFHVHGNGTFSVILCLIFCLIFLNYNLPAFGPMTKVIKNFLVQFLPMTKVIKNYLSPFL